jgi:hypothetical protein
MTNQNLLRNRRFYHEIFVEIYMGLRSLGSGLGFVRCTPLNYLYVMLERARMKLLVGKFTPKNFLNLGLVGCYD